MWSATLLGSAEISNISLSKFSTQIKKDDLVAGSSTQISISSGVPLFKGGSLAKTITVDCSTFPKGIILINVISNNQKQSI